MGKTTRFRRVRLSLSDLAGRPYVKALAAGRAVLTGEAEEDLLALATDRVNCFPSHLHASLVRRLPEVGTRVSPRLRPAAAAAGATTRAFAEATSTDSAPLSGWGFFRLGEDGRLRFAAKSEHYHAPLGHSFPGYDLIERARRLGVPNATHNNTRGHLTRRLEEELLRAAAGLARSDREGRRRLRRSRGKRVLNRVLNLETGSLAVEAGVKMMLARFYAPQPEDPAPDHAGKVPVFLVLGDFDGGRQANYHGTTALTQVLRGMWPAFGAGLEKAELFRVVTARPNRTEDLAALFRTWHRGRYRLAGCLHELVLMNYGGLRLQADFVAELHRQCHRHEVPVLVDEIQSCLWSPELFLYREYGLTPDFVAVGKGFPGGEYAASRLLFNARYDNLPQFGALVTNGQEELASLAYLITMRWAETNARVTGAVGEYYEERLRDLVRRYPQRLAEVQGRRHLASLYFHDLTPAQRFVRRLTEAGFDISVQSYKASCPPGALTKLPLIAGYEAVDFLVERMREALAEL
jgi:4-aminobutyrate aminotransferase-like enzyme